MEGEGESRHTRRCSDYAVDEALVPAGEGAQGLVADGDDNDGGEREEERGGGVDAPPAKDDAEVGRVPGEEHLAAGGWSAWGGGQR